MVNAREAKSNLSRFSTRVEAGDEVVIARAGPRVAGLVQAEQKAAGRRFLAQFGALVGRILSGTNLEVAEDEIVSFLDETDPSSTGHAQPPIGTDSRTRPPARRS